MSPSLIFLWCNEREKKGKGKRQNKQQEKKKIVAIETTSQL